MTGANSGTGMLLETGTGTGFTTTGVYLMYSQAIKPAKHKQVEAKKPSQKSFI